MIPAFAICAAQMANAFCFLLSSGFPVGRKLLDLRKPFL